MMALAMFIMLVVLVIYIARDKSGKVMLTLYITRLSYLANLVLLGMHVNPYVIGVDKLWTYISSTLFYQNGVNEKRRLLSFPCYNGDIDSSRAILVRQGGNMWLK